VTDVAGLLLTGGASARMGRDKGALFAAALAERLVAALPQSYEVGPGWTTLPVVADAGIGPLGALAAAAPVVSGQDVVVVACDMPFVTAELLSVLAAAPGTAVPVADGHAQTLCARYAAADVARAPALVAAGARSMRDLLDGTEVAWLHDLPFDFDDVDTPDDLARLGLVWP